MYSYDVIDAWDGSNFSHDDLREMNQLLESVDLEFIVRPDDEYNYALVRRQ